jgi:hypothetical protein
MQSHKIGSFKSSIKPKDEMARLTLIAGQSIVCNKTPEGRRRGDLELFVLTLIEDGVSTPYEPQQAARLSLGATIPALRRLLEGGLVLLGKAGTR